MNSGLRYAVPAVLSFVLLTAVQDPARAQLIGLKTVPIASGEQFLIHPSANMGMGGVWIGLDDPLLDPYINPARGVRAPRISFDATPTVYGSSSEQMVGGVTLPASVLFRGDRLFGGAGLAVQQLSDGNRDRFTPPPQFGAQPEEQQSFLSNGASPNRYAHAQLGTTATLFGRPVAVGGGVFWAGLSALDGVNRLYATARDVDQQGHIVDVRAGLLADLTGGRTLDAVLVHNRLDMSHEITYLDWVRGPDPTPWQGGWRSRVEHNLDQTATSGLQLRYTQPLSDEGARIGALFTANVKDHPKIPTYNVGNLIRIPRDPGNSTAFNFGVGFSNADENGAFGIDLLVQPAWSHTWADTTMAITSSTGRVIPKGDKTVENWFQFTNFAIAAGITRGSETRAFQLGLNLKSIHYTLEQQDYVRNRETNSVENWVEWSPSWGFTAKSPSFQVRYMGRITARGFPWSGWRTVAVAQEAPQSGGDFLVPVTEQVDFGEYWVFTNQVSITVPLKR